MDEKTLTVEDAVLAAARAAKDAQPVLARLHRADKDALLLAMAEALVDRADEIVGANARDLAAADAAGIAAGRDRLALDPGGSPRSRSSGRCRRAARPRGRGGARPVLANGLERARCACRWASSG